VLMLLYFGDNKAIIDYRTLSIPLNHAVFIENLYIKSFFRC
jgi:hypothetical protein